jgi:protein TonB
MNNVVTSSAQRPALWQPALAGESSKIPGMTTRAMAPQFELGRVYGERSRPPVKPARRVASIAIAIAIAIQALFVVGILAAGVKVPTKTGPLMVVDISTVEIKPEDLPPPPPTLVQPRVVVTMPFMPDIVPDVPPPPMPVNNSAISVAARGSAQAAPVYVAEKYETVLLRAINSALRYPMVARQRHQQGTVYVRFVMDRRGQVLSSQVERSSKFPALDEEGLALLARAQPLPAPPADVAGEQIQLVVPIVFSLR